MMDGWKGGLRERWSKGWMSEVGRRIGVIDGGMKVAVNEGSKEVV